MSGSEAMRLMVEHRISLETGTRFTSPGGISTLIWIARRKSLSASDEDACEAVRKLVEEMERQAK